MLYGNSDWRVMKPNKILILSTKTENLKSVLTNLTYGADISRPEQRGLLAARKGDIALLYDMDNGRLIGPFIIESDIIYSEEKIWEKTWPFRILLRPALVKIGTIQKKELLDLIMDVGKVSLRDPSTLNTYWINPLIMKEAKDFLDEFLNRARFISYEKLLELYRLKTLKPWNPKKVLKIREYICSKLSASHTSASPREWLIEAALSYSENFSKELIGLSDEILIANGIYVYNKRFLDILISTADVSSVVLLEIKRVLDRKQAKTAVSQVSYYAYSLSRGLSIPLHKIFPGIIYWIQRHERNAGASEDSITEAIMKFVEDIAVATYGIRKDKFFVAKVNAECKNGAIMVKHDLIL